MFGIATVTSKGQVTLPSALRRDLGIRQGDKLVLQVDGDRFIARKAAGFLDLAGSVPVPPDRGGEPWSTVLEHAHAVRGSA
ncbi:MAG: AbrB/MazE/SpoVT family DNA-binding domain-containing protein [Bifidobacteriaceae bacterium]|jgi:AbrB family looped-hinge helix DNA binding protein|nr:AbrB/MazE/SpoVT family DNA-binding domain-containing protein [Bifidobacteriaceae bacterium]